MKPRNILLVAQDDGADFVKIIDFGIAKQVAGSEADTPTPQDVDIPSLFPHRHSQRLKRHTQSTMGTLAGTPLYMSPEQCQGLPLDGRSDMYSFGCVLFEMLTGSAPFQRSTLVEVLDAHLTAPVPPLHPPKGDLTHSFEQLVLRMLAAPADSLTIGCSVDLEVL
jgi:serine/threonine-protein kinase